MSKHLIAFCIAAFVLYGCPAVGGHRLEGKWICGNAPVAIYEDGIAAYFGSKATWSKIDSHSIRIEFTENDRTMLGELAETKSSAGADGTAKFSVGRGDVKCSKIDE